MQKVWDIMKPFMYDTERTKEILNLFQIDLEKGLKKETNPTATMKCFPTFVQELPTGQESGGFLALDLGGTNFRVLYIELNNNKILNQKSKEMDIPVPIMTGKGEILFDYIAESLANFIQENKLPNGLPLGFTFSFPVAQQGLKSGTLVKWTKGFSAEGVEGEDVVAMLSAALERRRDIDIDIMVMLNDTVGTLVALGYQDQCCKIGVIIGTGSNACYVEKVENCTTFTEGKPGLEDIVINIEWGAFGEDGVLDPYTTNADKIADTQSVHPGKQIFEKMISGMYLGELVRLCIMECISAGCMFKGSVPGRLGEVNALKTRHLTSIESDACGHHKKCKNVLKELGVKKPSEHDLRAVRFIAECVTRRSATFVSAALAVLIPKLGLQNVTVGIDGALFKWHPHYERHMLFRMKDLISEDISYRLRRSDDGSGMGAAILAAAIKHSSG